MPPSSCPNGIARKAEDSFAESIEIIHREAAERAIPVDLATGQTQRTQEKSGSSRTTRRDDLTWPEASQAS
jgi:hypothetical protein